MKLAIGCSNKYARLKFGGAIRPDTMSYKYFVNDAITYVGWTPTPAAASETRTAIERETAQR